MARVRTRFPTLAQAISSSSKVAVCSSHRVCVMLPSHCSRSGMVRPMKLPLRRNPAKSAAPGSLRPPMRSALAVMIDCSCASSCAMLAPGFRRPIEREYSLPRAVSAASSGVHANGTITAASRLGKKNPCGMTPITRYGLSSRRMLRSRMSDAPAKRDCHVA
jgi:hypothetical protein